MTSTAATATSTISDDEVHECLICMEKVVLPVKMSCACKTQFCLNCLATWLGESSATRGCPLCRTLGELVTLEPAGVEYYDNLCQQGYSLIAKAELGGFEDKTLLKQAASRGFLAARHMSDRAEAYILLAYLHLLIDLKTKARALLDNALAVEPNNQDAARLIEYINEQPSEATDMTTEQGTIQKSVVKHDDEKNSS